MKKDYENVVVNNFRDYLFECQYADNTISNYCKVVNDFVKFFSIIDMNGLYKINKSQVLKFVNSFKDRKLKIITINNHIIALNIFFKFCLRNDLRVKTYICKRKTYLNDNELLTDEEIHKILNYANKFRDKRYFYAILIMLQTGIRVSELQFVKIESLKNKNIRIFNKGSYREVPMADDLICILNRYCEQMNITEGIILRTKNNKCIDRSVISRKLKRIAIKLGIDLRKVHSHNFRHDFALRYLKYNGYNALSNLADLLGHKSIETTRIYTRMTFTKLRLTMTRKILNIKIAS